MKFDPRQFKQYIFAEAEQPFAVAVLLLSPKSKFYPQFVSEERHRGFCNGDRAPVAVALPLKQDEVDRLRMELDINIPRMGIAARVKGATKENGVINIPDNAVQRQVPVVIMHPDDSVTAVLLDRLRLSDVGIVEGGPFTYDEDGITPTALPVGTVFPARVNPARAPHPPGKLVFGRAVVTRARDNLCVVLLDNHLAPRRADVDHGARVTIGAAGVVARDANGGGGRGFHGSLPCSQYKHGDRNVKAPRNTGLA